MAVIQGGGTASSSLAVKPTVNSINLMPPVVKPPAPTINSINQVNPTRAQETGWVPPSPLKLSLTNLSPLGPINKMPPVKSTLPTNWTGVPQSLTMADYNATQRFIDEANQGRWMGLITPNMLLASGGSLTPDLLSMNNYTQNANGSWTRNNPIDNTLDSGGSGGGGWGGGGGYGGGGYGGGGGANASDMINWRIGF